MHTTSSARGQGIGRALLDHVLALAAERRYHRVSLETGTMPVLPRPSSVHGRRLPPLSAVRLVYGEPVHHLHGVGHRAPLTHDSVERSSR